MKNCDWFPINKVSVIAREVKIEDELATCENKFIRNKTRDGLGKGMAAGSALGGIAGLLVGLGAVTLPDVGYLAIAGGKSFIAGLYVGGYYGAAAGGIVGVCLGNRISKNQAKIYNDRLAEGDYLVILDGTIEEMQLAESVLKNYGIQDRRVS